MSMTESSFIFPDTPTVTSPELPVQEGIVHTPKQFSDALTLDLTDDEIQRALQIIVQTSRKWRTRFSYRAHLNSFHDVEDAMRLVDQFEDEIKSRLAEMHLLATVDVTPLLNGEAPVVELVGALPTHSSAQYGLDHERKSWEVQKAKRLGQDFLGSDDLE